MKRKNFQTFSSPHGPALIADFYLLEKKVQKIELSAHSKPGLQWSIDADSSDSSVIEAICHWMEAYAQRKNPTVDLPLNLESLPPYTLFILQALQTIPFGHSLSYQELAKKTYRSKAARAVGNACGRNPFPLVIPCHRVLASGGKLGGYSGGETIKESLLAFEGIVYQ